MDKMLELDIETIETSELNPRKHFDEEKLKDLAASIKEKGVLQPIVVRSASWRAAGAKPGVYEIVCGERRYRAAKLAGLTTIPAIVRALDDKQVLEIQVVENLQREDVHPLEEAEGYSRLMKQHGYATVDDVAAKVGKSKAYVYSRLKLNDLVTSNRKLYLEGRFTAAAALALARVPEHLQVKCAQEALRNRNPKEPVSLVDMRREIEREAECELKGAGFDLKDKTLLAAAGPCTTCAKRTINQKGLFPDLVDAGDRCMDPVCLSRKKTIDVERKVTAAAAAGKKVLTREQCKKIFPQTWSGVEGGYVDLNEPLYVAGKKITLRELISAKCKNAQIMVAVHPHKMEIREVVTVAEKKRILTAAGVKGSGSPYDSNGDNRAKRAKAKRAERDRKDTLGRIMEALGKSIRADKKQRFLRPLAEAVLLDSKEDIQRMFMLRRDPSLKRDEISGALEAHLKAIDDSELLWFITELVMLGQALWSGYGETALVLCEIYDVDVKTLDRPPKEVSNPVGVAPSAACKREAKLPKAADRDSGGEA